jgi:lysine 2,3-aminomutase
LSGQVELISPYLKKKIEESEQRFGRDSEIVRILKRQYLWDPKEEEIFDNEKKQHYEADIFFKYMGKELKGIERLYRQVIVINLTTACITNCRYCLRRFYQPIHLSNEELQGIAKFCGCESINSDIKEVLISGGDPFIIPIDLEKLIDLIEEYAPNVRIIRIGSRLPVQDPEKINKRLLSFLRPRKNIRFELGTQVNHASELFPEVKEAFKKLFDIDITIYNQSILLKGVNDNISALISLFDQLRDIGIENHYLFHAVPIKGTHHHRTSLEKGLKLIRELTNCGVISGRSNPMYTAMTDIGKIVLNDGVILEKKNGYVLLQSFYSYEDRKKWNPNWKLPELAVIDNNGYMRVWYFDGVD